MPLGDPNDVAGNIAKLRLEGKPMAQAMAIALHMKREHEHKKKVGHVYEKEGSEMKKAAGKDRRDDIRSELSEEPKMEKMKRGDKRHKMRKHESKVAKHHAKALKHHKMAENGEKADHHKAKEEHHHKKVLFHKARMESYEKK